MLAPPPPTAGRNVQTRLLDRSPVWVTPALPGLAAKRRRDVVARRHPDPAEVYPYQVEVAEQFAKHGYDYTSEFEFGLDLILDCIQRLRKRTA